MALPVKQVGDALAQQNFEHLDGLLTTLKVHRVIGAATVGASGPLPLSGTFDATGGDCHLLAWGTAFKTVAASVASMKIKLDGVEKGEVFHAFTAANTHYAMAPTYLQLGTLSGSHTIDLTANLGLTSDSNDRFTVVILELP